MQANIYKIEQISAPDGSGTGTAVYFSGCPLRCSKCSTPQTPVHPTRILWDSRQCLFCRLCEGNCPTGSLSLSHNRLDYHAETCTGCFSCVRNCPARSIHFVGTMMELEDVMDMILKETPPEGCVTLAGGDALMQPAFAAALLKQCREHSFHTVLETTGFSQSLDFARVIAEADQLLINIKHYSEKKHVQYTGVSNQSILDNLDFAIATGKPVAARIIVTPGLNTAACDAQKFGELLTAHHVHDVHLLRFGHAASDCSDEPFSSADSFSEEDMNRYADILRSYRLNVEIFPKAL